MGEAGWPCVLANIGMSQSGSLPGAKQLKEMVPWEKMWEVQVVVTMESDGCGPVENSNSYQ